MLREKIKYNHIGGSTKSRESSKKWSINTEDINLAITITILFLLFFCGAQHSAWIHDLEIKTWAEIELAP